MTNNQLTREHLIKELKRRISVTENYPDLETARIDAIICKMALAAMDGKPVAWLLSGGGAKNVVCFDSGNAYADPLREVTPLYRHAQPLLTPEIKWRAQEALVLRDRIAEMESRTVTVKPPEDGTDSDVSSRNQPGMVVAVHIDAGDFVKVKGQVFEVKETDFDDHDVTLWFVGGNALQCAAGCQIEVVAAPDAAGINVEAE